MFETAGSQSIDWFWLPVTRSSMTGSLASDCTLRLPVTERVTPRMCAVPVWKELLPDEVRPLSNTWTLRSGPERPPAMNERWSGPNVPSSLQGLPFVLQFFPFHVPWVCSQVQFSSTVCGPLAAIGRPAAEVQVTSPDEPPGVSE